MARTQHTPQARTMLAVDYPRQGESIEVPFYSIRLSAPEDAAAMEIAIDQGDWRACRKAAGYWWYDWSGYESGEHEIVARLRIDGRIVTCEPHEFFVRLPAAAPAAR